MNTTSRNNDLLLTASAPLIWGSTYVITTTLLPQGSPLSLAALRALPAGLVLLLIARRLPEPDWWIRVMILGALNISFFLWMLFIAAYRLPGGVAATVAATQPLLVLVFARLAMGTPIAPTGVIAALGGIAGVALLVLGPKAALDPVGLVAAVAGAMSMAAGNVLTHKWQPKVSPLTFTAWQLTAGGLLLIPIAFMSEAKFPPPTFVTFAGLMWLGLVGSAMTYFIWFRGIAKLGPATVTAFVLLSPLSATFLGWLILGQRLTLVQCAGGMIVLASVWLGQRAGRPVQ